MTSLNRKKRRQYKLFSFLGPSSIQDHSLCFQGFPNLAIMPTMESIKMLLRLTQQDDLAMIYVWVDRSIPGTFESSARSLRLRNRAWNISFDAGGRRVLCTQSAPASRAPASKPGHCFCAEIAGTIMNRSHLPIQEWFWAADLVATHTPEISAVQIQRQLGSSSDTTAWPMRKAS